MKFQLLFLGLICFSQLFGQMPEDCDYQSPLDIPLVLSGTFGELRGNHFHSGIDIKTNGRIGASVYAIGDGYISRIRVSPYGFGKAIYIKHPEGYTSVYAHLNGFEKFLDDYVKAQQYARESFAVDLYFGPKKFVVSKGQKIADSGNSGGSGGPHLHFEIRNSANEYPMNPFLFGFEVADHRPPHLQYLIIDVLDTGSFVNGKNEQIKIPLTKNSTGQYEMSGKKTIELYGRIGFAISNYDKLDDAENKNGSYELELRVNGKSLYHHELNSFGFHETRFINSHITYDSYSCCRIKAQKCYLDPNNRLSFTNGNPKAYHFTSEGNQSVEILVSDFASNQSLLAFPIQVREPKEKIKTEQSGKHKLYCQRINQIQEGELKLYMGLGCLYKDVSIDIEYENLSSYLTSSFSMKIGESSIPVHKSYELSFPVKGFEAIDQDKVLLARKYANGKYSAKGGKIINGQMKVKLREFGEFELRIDTIAPFVRPLDIRDGSILTKRKSFSFQIKDELSGVEKYRAEIDGEWILMEYDPKNNLLIHYLEDGMESGEHELVLKVWDERENLTEKRIRFSI